MKPLIAVTLVCVAMPLAVLAQHDHGGGGMSMPMPSAPALRTGKLTGTLVSRDDTSITVEPKQKGNPTTFMVDHQTKFKGPVEPGAAITVKFQEQAGMQKATGVEAKKARSKQLQ